MTWALISLTLRALLNRRRTLLLALLGLLLVGIVALYQLSGPSAEQALEVTRRLLSDLGIGVLLPLVAVIVGTAAIGSELDDGTIVSLLATPGPGWLSLLVTRAGAGLVTGLLGAPAWAIAAILGGGDPGLALGFVAGTIVGALEYTAIFVALSLMTSRALVVGLAYVVVWEGVIAGLFAGTRTLSVRQHVLALVEAVGGTDASGLGSIEASTALIAMLIATVAATLIAIRRLQVVELRGETA